MLQRSNFAVICVVGLLVCLLLQANAADAAEDAQPPTTLAELESAISRVLEEHEVPAIGIALVDANGPVWVTALGTANLENATAVDSNSMFRIGSTSKMFVALAVLKLVEEGRLSLQDKVADLASEIEFENQWESTAPVRIVHLLEHTTGWDDIHLPEYGHNDPTPATLQEGIDFHPHSRVSRWQPGSRMSYCNSGPPIAAYIVAKITGQNFEDYVAENFFAPLGMDSATYRLNAVVESRGVTLYNNGNMPQDYWHILMRPSGSINASSIDMQKMVSFFVNRGIAGGARLISLASLQRMERAGSTPAAAAGQASGYGLNNYTSAYASWSYHGHNGGVNGGLTELAYLPDQQLGYAFMINSGDGAAYGKISDLIRGFQTHALTPPAVTPASEISALHRDRAGFYAPINSRQEAGYFLERVFGVQKIWFDENTLLRKAVLGGDSSAYLASSPLLYRSADTGITALSFVDDPLAGPVVHADTVVMRPISSVLVYGQLAIVLLWVVAIISSFGFFLVWGVRRWRGKIAPGPPIRIRVWPLLAALSVVLFVWMLVLGIRDPFEKLGYPTTVSVTIMLATLAFAACALLGTRSFIVLRDAGINRGTYWHSAIASCLHLTVAAYLLYFGAIGMMTWT